MAPLAPDLRVRSSCQARMPACAYLMHARAHKCAWARQGEGTHKHKCAHMRTQTDTHAHAQHTAHTRSTDTHKTTAPQGNTTQEGERQSDQRTSKQANEVTNPRRARNLQSRQDRQRATLPTETVLCPTQASAPAWLPAFPLVAPTLALLVSDCPCARCVVFVGCIVWTRMLCMCVWARDAPSVE